MSKNIKSLKEIYKIYFPKHFERKYNECIKCRNKKKFGICWNCYMNKLFNKYFLME